MLLSLVSISLAAVVQAQYYIPPELYSPLVAQKTLNTAQRTPNPYPQWTKLPPYGTDEGKWQYFGVDTWTSGFLPASLMLLNERGRMCPQGQLVSSIQAANSLDQGRKWSVPLTTLEQTNNVKHDVGFISFPFWEELKMNPGNTTAQTHVNAFAKYLAGRFSPIVGCTKSWDSSKADEFQVIIDNMINLELFFISADLTGNQTYRNMAISHADHTMANHIRPDGSTYHVVVYNSSTGAVTAQRTNQGYADSSTWSRGQAWGMYGFTSMYNRTREVRYLDTARRLSQYYLGRLPTDSGVPPWDFDAPSSPTPPRDTSSAMIASSAMLFLAQMEKSLTPSNTTGSDYWIQQSLKLLKNTVAVGWRTEPQWEALLSNGTANNPVKNYNSGLVYGDYYFIKAGNSLLSMGLANCSSATATSTTSQEATTNSGRALSRSKSTLFSGAALGLLARCF